MGWLFACGQDRTKRARGARVFALVAGAAALLGASGSADAYEIKRTPLTKELVHWETDDLSFVLDPGVESAVPTGASAVLSAVGSWSGTVGAPNLRAAAAVAPEKPGFDGTNAVYFMKDGWAPAGRALAITVLTYDSKTGRILDADIIFNGKYRFAVLSPTSDANVARVTETPGSAHVTNTDGVTHVDEGAALESAVYDLHHVAAHEVGHSLGMNDEHGKKDALMYRYSAPNDASARTPTPDDIAGLAELYSTTLEGQGSGCGGANVAPKKPSARVGSTAMFAALGLMLFLVLRARTDRRARFGFVAAAAASALLLLPSAGGDGATREASASELAPGHARAHVTDAHTVVEGGLFRTEFRVSTDACRRGVCPPSATGAAWGGAVGDIRQDIGGHYAPRVGDRVDISYDKLPDSLTALRSPLAGRAQVTAAGVVRVLTRSN